MELVWQEKFRLSKFYVKSALLDEWSRFNKKQFDFENFMLNQLHSMNGAGLTKIISTSKKFYVKQAPLD